MASSICTRMSLLTWKALALLALWYAGTVRALAPIEIKGSKFFDEDGEQFFIKGT
jgi:hypothetical protein